jgi:hypothetical protein
MRKLNFAFALASALVLVASTTQAQELLTNGALDAAIPPPAFDGWTLTETVTGEPATPINSAQVQDFADQDPAPGGTGLWLRPFEGNIGPNAGLDKAINAYLVQTVPGTAGLSYTFSGYSRWETNYSGGVANMDADKLAPPDMAGPPSPTDTTMRIEFLDGGNSVIGSSSLDLRTVQTNANTWLQHTLTPAVAPAGTVSVRVTAEATDMKFNVDPGQSAFYDTFSLTDSGAPATERLTNGGLNLGPPQPPPGWSLVESGGDTASPSEGFADRPPGPGLGLWLRPFATGTPVGDATLSQTVGVLPGRDITFSGWSKWEPNYSGGVPFSATNTTMEMQFLDGSNAPVGAPITLNLRTEQLNDNTWRQHDLNGTVPLGATQVRVSAIADNMFNNPGLPNTGGQSAFFDDFSVLSVPEPTSVLMLFCGVIGLFGLARRR